jgi:hypothetical protein
MHDAMQLAAVLCAPITRCDGVVVALLCFCNVFLLAGNGPLGKPKSDFL